MRKFVLKKFLPTLVTIGLIIFPSLTFASLVGGNTDNSTDSGNTTNNTTTNQQSSTTTQDQTTQQQTDNLTTQADNEVDRRVTALNSVEDTLNSLNNLTNSQKSDFTNQINQNISSLNSLKTKIGSDTDPATLQGDVQSIVSSYRVFYIFIPQIHLLAAADVITTANTNLTVLANHLQARITQDINKGQNVTILTAALADMRLKINDANSQETAITNSVEPLTPAGFPGNIPTLRSALTDATAARADIATAQKDGQTIINDLKTLETNSSGAASNSSS